MAKKKAKKKNTRLRGENRVADLMERMRAARAVVESHNQATESYARVRAFAFLSLMHPELNMRERLLLARDMAEQKAQ